MFATTHWSIVLQAGDSRSPEAEAALGTLYQTYSYPLYAFIRRQGHAPETAQDLVQEVFLSLLENKQLANVRPERGRFRSYLMAAANHLLANEWRKQRREKRGGGRALVALDGLEAEERYRLEPVDGKAPDVLFEQRWALTLLDSVFARLSSEWRTAGKARAFEALKPFLSADGDTLSSTEVAQTLGTSDGALRVAVHRLRQRYRELLREEIAGTVGDAGEVEDEIRHLIAALRP